MVETMSKSSVRYVHRMAIKMGYKFLFFNNSPSELNFLDNLRITEVC
jgi:hypothetical protein